VDFKVRIALSLNNHVVVVQWSYDAILGRSVSIQQNYLLPCDTILARYMLTSCVCLCVCVSVSVCIKMA